MSKCPTCQKELMVAEVPIAPHVSALQGTVPITGDIESLQYISHEYYIQKYKCENGHVFARKSVVPIR